MAQSLAKNYIHLIFSTKERFPFLNEIIRNELHAYAIGILNDQDSPTIAINSVSDHLHILFCLNKNIALTDAVMQLKKGTSRWIKSKGLEFGKFQWQSGYGAFSVSPSNVPAVTEYIQNQAEHHRRVSFQDEFRAFLKRHDVEWDERYVWG